MFYCNEYDDVYRKSDGKPTHWKEHCKSYRTVVTLAIYSGLMANKIPVRKDFRALYLELEHINWKIAEAMLENGKDNL